MGIVEKVKLPLKRKMDKIMFSLAIYGVMCLTVTILMFLFTLAVYLLSKSFRKVVNREIKNYFCCMWQQRKDQPLLTVDEIFLL